MADSLFYKLLRSLYSLLISAQHCNKKESLQLKSSSSTSADAFMILHVFGR